MTILEASEQALSELTRLHEKDGVKCPGCKLCPTAAAIRDLTRAVANERAKEIGLNPQQPK